MSQWTHVCGAIRYDDLQRAIAQPTFVDFLRRELQKVITAPPRGSEGPLIVTWTHGHGEVEGYQYMSTATITGDLRDFGLEDVGELRTWWEEITTVIPVGVLVRNGVLQIQVEGVKETIILQAQTGNI